MNGIVSLVTVFLLPQVFSELFSLWICCVTIVKGRIFLFFVVLKGQCEVLKWHLHSHTRYVNSPQGNETSDWLQTKDS